MKKLIRERVVPRSPPAFPGDLWYDQLRFAFFPEVGEKEKHAGEPLLTGIEELVYQVLLNPNIAVN